MIALLLAPFRIAARVADDIHAVSGSVGRLEQVIASRLRSLDGRTSALLQASLDLIPLVREQLAGVNNLQERYAELADRVESVRESVERNMSELHSELLAMRTGLDRLVHDVESTIDRLPGGTDSAGPLARLRDVMTSG